MATELRRIGVSDKEILKTVQQVRIKQLTSKEGGPNTYAILGEEELSKVGLPKGTVAQRNQQTGKINVVPAADKKTGSARERIMKKLASGEGIITPGEQDVLLLNITDILQREDVATSVARHNQCIRSGGNNVSPGRVQSSRTNKRPAVYEPTRS